LLIFRLFRIIGLQLWSCTFLFWWCSDKTCSKYA